MLVRSYRVLHVLDHSWPVLSGYSIRSKSLVDAQRRIGLQPAVVTGPLHQLDDQTGCELFAEGVHYARTPLAGRLARQALVRRWTPLREVEVIRLLERRISQLLESAEFDLVHAHSPSLCGLAAWRSARKHRLPFVYEIRAFWEEGAVLQNRLGPRSLRYRLSRRLELFVAQRADAVVGIAQHILDDMQARGIPAAKLFHVPNGVDADRFTALPRDTELARELKLRPDPVLGFIGSLYQFEGISWLVGAAAALRRQRTAFQVLLIGHGEDTERIRAAIGEARAEDYIRLLPAVPHDQVRRYYSLMDVMVYPRLRTPLTEKVTPLKPLEAMAQEKPVLASGVGGIRELIQDEKTGLLFSPEDVQDFCRQAQRLLMQESLRSQLGACARQMVLREKDWKILAGRYPAVYEAAAGAPLPKTAGMSNS